MTHRLRRNSCDRIACTLKKDSGLATRFPRPSLNVTRLPGATQHPSRQKCCSRCRRISPLKSLQILSASCLRGCAGSAGWPSKVSGCSNVCDTSKFVRATLSGSAASSDHSNSSSMIAVSSCACVAVLACACRVRNVFVCLCVCVCVCVCACVRARAVRVCVCVGVQNLL